MSLPYQFKEAKESCGDAILLFRCGDFYESYLDDARICSQTLGLTLTSRQRKGEEPVAMTGFPYHFLEAYLAKLVASGHRVAVCEQIPGGPQQVKKFVAPKDSKVKQLSLF